MEIEPSEAGTAGRLLKSCIHLFWLLIKKIDTVEGLQEEQKLALRDELARLYFWGRGFNIKKGGLDKILRLSVSLRDQTISLLMDVGRTLSSRETGLFRIVVSDGTDSKLDAQRQDLTSLIERLEVYANETQEFDSESNVSGDSDLDFSLESVLGDLQTYVGCLTKLTISLEHPAPDLVEAKTSPVPATNLNLQQSSNQKSGDQILFGPSSYQSSHPSSYQSSHPSSYSSSGESSRKPKPKPYLCLEPGCETSFTRPFDLSRHQKTSHRAGVHIDCPESWCGRSGPPEGRQNGGFSRLDHFYEHVKKVHRKEVIKDSRGTMLVKSPDGRLLEVQWTKPERERGEREDTERRESERRERSVKKVHGKGIVEDGRGNMWVKDSDGLLHKVPII